MLDGQSGLLPGLRDARRGGGGVIGGWGGCGALLTTMERAGACWEGRACLPGSPIHQVPHILRVREPPPPCRAREAVRPCCTRECPSTQCDVAWAARPSEPVLELGGPGTSLEVVG